MLIDLLERCIEAEHFKFSEVENNSDEIFNLGCFVKTVNDRHSSNNEEPDEQNLNFDLSTLGPKISLVSGLSYNKFWSSEYSLNNYEDKVLDQ
uniref:Uncharacterized protein n=1 Tax=Caenorhabditis tropicalis TaxID=1561998 RepID=A0A1I7ULI9_9PELO